MDEKELKKITEDELNPAVPQEIPKSTYWPIFLAFSIILFFWGFLTSLIISAAGLCLTGVSIAGWIGELKQ